MMWLLVCSQHYGKTRGTTPKVKGNLSLIFGRSTASSSIKEHFVLPLSTFPCRAPMKLQSHDEFYPNDMHWGVHTLQDRVCSTLSKPFWTFLPHKIPWNNFQVSETPAETNLLLVSKKKKNQWCHAAGSAKWCWHPPSDGGGQSAIAQRTPINLWRNSKVPRSPGWSYLGIGELLLKLILTSVISGKNGNHTNS